MKTIKATGGVRFWLKLIICLMLAPIAFAQGNKIGNELTIWSAINVDDTLIVAINYFAGDFGNPPGGFDIWIMEHGTDTNRVVDQGEISRIGPTDRFFKITDFHIRGGEMRIFDPTKNYSLKVEARYTPWPDWCTDEQWSGGMGGGCWPLSNDFDYFYVSPDEHLHWSAALSNLTDSTSKVTMNTTFKVIEWQYHVDLSSRSSNGVDVQERLYFTNHPDSSKLSWRKLIVDGSNYYRFKYMNRLKKWVDVNPDQVYEVIERSQYRLVYRLYGPGTPLVTAIQKHGRVTEIWNYNID